MDEEDGGRGSSGIDPNDLSKSRSVAEDDRTHVLTFNYVYELPFFREGHPVAKGVLGGWQIAGITQMWSGPPISRVINGNTNGSRRGIRVNQLSDPFENVPAESVMPSLPSAM